MKILSRKAAFELFVKLFGPYKGWGRTVHIAYALIRGVDYQKLERVCNDEPQIDDIARKLHLTCIFSELEPPPVQARWWTPPKEIRAEVVDLVKWIKKPVRKKKMRPTNLVATSEGGRDGISV